MQRIVTDPRTASIQVIRRRQLLLAAAGALLMTGVSLTILLASGFTILSLERWTLLVGSLGLLAVSLVPAIASMRLHSNRFDLFHPLFRAAWFFFIPQFTFAVLLMLFFGFETSLSSLTADTDRSRVIALAYAYLGTIGLSLGYFLPLGRNLGNRLPAPRALDYPPSRLRLAALIFLTIGLGGQLAAFQEGTVGYQLSPDISLLGATFAALGQLALIGHGMVWYSYFRTRRGWGQLVILSLVILVLDILLSGSRGTPFHAMLIVIGAYQYAQEQGRLRSLWKWLVLAMVLLFAGLVFGTFFRSTKIGAFGRATTISVGETLTVSRMAATELSGHSASDVLSFGWERLAERVDGITSLAVIVSQADRLKSLESAFGVEHNIVRDLATSLIPRVLWPSKPVVGGSEQIGNLYFGSKNSSPAVTYMGDLFRNFGAWGILPGMAVLGIALRGLYAWLIERRMLSPLRVGSFLALGGLANYEALYSTFFPALIRAFVVIAVGVLIIEFAGLISAPVRFRTQR